MGRALWELAKVAPRWRVGALALISLLMCVGWALSFIDGAFALVDGFQGDREMTLGWVLAVMGGLLAPLIPVMYRAELVGVIAIAMVIGVKAPREP